MIPALSASSSVGKFLCPAKQMSRFLKEQQQGQLKKGSKRTDFGNFVAKKVSLEEKSTTYLRTLSCRGGWEISQ